MPEDYEDGLGPSSMGEAEVEEPKDKINITAPREPEVNPEVYTDWGVIDMLTHGFLMQPVDIGDVPFVFKSLNQHEFQMIRLLSGYQENRPLPPRFWDLFLAHMVLFADGQNMLVDRRKGLGQLVGMFRDLPNSARQRLVRQLSELNRKASNATMLVEVYATESSSRWRWAQTHGIDLSSSALTGIEGTDKLGLNYAQLTWRAINYYEDMRHRQDVEWENSKFIGGCFAGKGIQKIHNQDRDRHQKERDERWNRKDQLLRHVLFGEPLEADKRYGGAQVVIVASTVEELADQVQRSLRGEKDWHDEVVSEYETRIRQNVASKQGQLQELVDQHRDEMHGKELVGQTNLAGLSPKDVAQRLQEQMRREAEIRARAAEGPPPLDETTSDRMSRWGLMGESLPQTDRPTEGAIPLQSRRTTGKPWRP